MTSPSGTRSKRETAINIYVSQESCEIWNLLYAHGIGSVWAGPFVWATQSLRLLHIHVVTNCWVIRVKYKSDCLQSNEYKWLTRFVLKVPKADVCFSIPNYSLSLAARGQGARWWWAPRQMQMRRNRSRLQLVVGIRSAPCLITPRPSLARAFVDLAVW